MKYSEQVRLYSELASARMVSGQYHRGSRCAQSMAPTETITRVS
jgi:hypothetical protein